MAARCRLICVVAALLSACASDLRYDGDLSRCTNDAFNNDQIFLTLDAPTFPQVTGFFGQADSDDRNTWTATEVEDGQQSGPNLEFLADFDFGGGGVKWTERWTVTLEGQGGSVYEGEAEIEITTRLGGFASNTETVRCDVELERTH